MLSPQKTKSPVHHGQPHQRGKRTSYASMESRMETNSSHSHKNHLRLFFEKYSTISNLQGRDQIIITRIRSGHTKDTYFFPLTKDPAPTCGICNSPTSIDHFILTFPKYNVLCDIHKIRNFFSNINNQPRQ